MVQERSKVKRIAVLVAVVVVLAALLMLCPEIPSVIIGSLFNDNFRVSVFFFVIGVFVLESVALSVLKKRGAVTRRALVIVMIAASVVGGALLIADPPDRYDAPQMFTCTGDKCLITAYKDAFDRDPDEFDGTDMIDYYNEMIYIHEAGGRNESLAPISHFVIVMLIFATGYMLLTFAFDGERRLLSAFAAFPVGAAIVCGVGLCFIVAGIPIRRITIIPACLITLAVLSFLIARRHLWKDSQGIVQTFLITAIVVLVIVWGRSAWLTPDSVEKTMHGMMLAEYDLVRREIFTFSAYGFIEPIIHCVAWRFGVDFLYSFYPLMALSSLGIIIAAAMELVPDAGISEQSTGKCIPIILVTGISVIFLATNYDFATLGVWVMSNGAIGTYILLVMVFILIAARHTGESREKNLIWPLVFVFAALITTRVEGAIYIILLLALALGISAFRCGYISWCLAAAALSVLWNILQFAFYSGEFSAFWNPSNGIIVIAGAAALILIALFSRIPAKLVQWVMRHYYVLSVIVFLLAGVVAVSAAGKFGIKTFDVFLRHFASSDYNNSAAIWSYLLLMLPLLVCGRRKETAFTIVVVADYLLMALVMLCMRQDGSPHLAVGDSSRRVIQQIMPTAMLTVALGAGRLFSETER